LLIVSHDKASIQSICDRAILLNAGKLVMEGQPEAVMDYYNALLAEHQGQSIRQEVCPMANCRQYPVPVKRR
jgi:lipopolysaccharide transport system ATP-binding protein